MRISGAKVLGVSLAVGLTLGVAGGLAFALLGDGVIAHGIGTGLFIVGLIPLALGLLGATEPNEGWRRGASPQRRGLAAQLALDHADIDRVTSLDLLVWGIVVGGTLIALSMVAFYFAAPG